MKSQFLAKLIESSTDRSVLSVMGPQPDQRLGDFYCSNKNLTSLEGSPKSVTGTFSCSGNNLETLKGAPQYVGRNFYCKGNKLTSFVEAPLDVRGYFYCNDKLPMLSMLMNGGIKQLHSSIRVAKIMNPYLTKAPCSRADILKCQQELIDAGFDEEAEF